jgi:hypothetical protein
MAKGKKQDKKKPQKSNQKVQVKKPAEVLGVSSSSNPRKRRGKNKTTQRPTQQTVMVIDANGKKKFIKRDI